MRTFKLIAGLVLVLGFSAIGVASASAAEILWPWLPGSAKETFTGKTGSLTLQTDNGSKIICSSSTISLTLGTAHSELLENAAKLALALMELKGCKAEKILPLNSLGDAKEIILLHLEIHNCMIKPGDFGVLIKLLPAHVEVPSLALLILVEGSLVARIKPLVGSPKHYELEMAQANGLQAIEKCEGGEKENLLCSDNGGAFVECGWEATAGLLLFDGTIDANGEEMMEK